MIPTVLLIALVGAIVFPRHLGWVALAATISWSVIVLIEGSTDSAAELLAVVAVGAANAVAAVALVWIFRRAVATD